METPRTDMIPTTEREVPDLVAEIASSVSAVSRRDIITLRDAHQGLQTHTRDYHGCATL